MDNRAIIGASASAARTFDNAASRAASSDGSTPSRVNAEMTLSDIPFLFITNRGEEEVIQIRIGQRKSSGQRHDRSWIQMTASC
jgi:hypothetical protein